MKTTKQIQDNLKGIETGEQSGWGLDEYMRGYANALRWVLGKPFK